MKEAITGKPTIQIGLVVTGLILFLLSFAAAAMEDRPPSFAVVIWGYFVYLAYRGELMEVADGQPFVVCTGGEPLLQLDAALIAACTARASRSR